MAIWLSIPRSEANFSWPDAPVAQKRYVLPTNGVHIRNQRGRISLNRLYGRMEQNFVFLVSSDYGQINQLITVSGHLLFCCFPRVAHQLQSCTLQIWIQQLKTYRKQ